jgi:hypothetical protein
MPSNSVGFAAVVDGKVRFGEGLADGGDRAVLGMLGIDVRNAVGGHLAGQLAHRVGPHAVGDEKNMAAGAELLGVARRQGRVGVLVVAAANPNVGQAGIFDVVVANHPRTPRSAWHPSSPHLTAAPRQMVV